MAPPATQIESDTKRKRLDGYLKVGSASPSHFPPSFPSSISRSSLAYPSFHLLSPSVFRFSFLPVRSSSHVSSLLRQRFNKQRALQACMLAAARMASLSPPSWECLLSTQPPSIKTGARVHQHTNNGSDNFKHGARQTSVKMSASAYRENMARRRRKSSCVPFAFS